ncbi:thiamine diphosphokinase [Desulfobacter latus]|uniref:Thiamine diphosphokinase n=1 Tax=Desulfobacter latus TaxID=2292 RepID=A0A850T626_9BACT|nr:thiamine diphosphokinase [Desulfobacter latus]NWH04415.1 thiamine diphosphokinase [Desulfobacter latus]
MKTIIIANGTLSETDGFLSRIQQADLVIAADGGAVHLYHMGLVPRVIIGDLDSIPENILSFFKEKQVKILKHPVRKDQTDMELCMEYAIDHGCTDLLIMGATSTRLDHTLANIFLLRRLADQGIPATILDGYNDIHIAVSRLTLTGCPGDLISVIPISDHVKGLTLEGLEYPLTDQSLCMGSTMGISNVFIQDKAEITLKSGAVLVIKPKEDN